MKYFVIINIMFYLIFSPMLFADNFPKRIELTYLSSNDQYAIKKYQNDYIMYNVLNPDKRITIQKEFTKDIAVEEINSYLMENGSRLVTYAVSLPAGFESKSSILLNGEIDSEGDNFIAQVRRPDGSVIEDVNIKAFKNGENLRATVIIIVGGLALIGIACAIANMVTNCGNECKNACADHGGVNWYEELWCGRCECHCNK